MSTAVNFLLRLVFIALLLGLWEATVRFLEIPPSCCRRHPPSAWRCTGAW